MVGFLEIPKTDRLKWLEWRHTGIGSSDASVLMGVSRFKTRKQLLIEKYYPFSGEDQANSYIKDRGNKIEIQVRKYLEDMKGTTFSAMSCESKVFPFMKASLDGISPDNRTIIEIKLLSSVNPAKVNKEAEGYIKWDKALQGAVPREYYPQIQHQLMITGADVCLFVGYKEVKGDYIVTSDKLAIVAVYPDKQYIKELAKKEFEFWYEMNELKYRGELE